ncbi:MAG TPA: zinc ribbon domain-containing protein [Ktedonobacteraceae bacterium]
MQCSTCGTQLPQGAAYCPTCGSTTPYQLSSSEISPSDATMISSSTQSAPYSYPLPNPYDTPPFVPPPPPPPRQRRFSGFNIALLIVILLLLIGGGGFLALHQGSPINQPSSQASPTTQARQVTITPAPTLQATALPTPVTPQGLYTQITGTPPTLNDPLSTNDANNWAESSAADGSCAFTGGAYHARAQQKNGYMLCVAQATNFSDLAYQVQMTIVKGEFGGIVFRTDSSQSKYYSFFIDSSGNYTLVTSVDNTGTRDYVLHKGTSASIKTGLNQTNLLAIVARGSNIYLYINQQYITSANDSTYHDGQIGVFGGDSTQAPADVAFSHVQVWKV